MATPNVPPFWKFPTKKTPCSILGISNFRKPPPVGDPPSEGGAFYVGNGWVAGAGITIDSQPVDHSRKFPTGWGKPVMFVGEHNPF
jgi:hypothetical protein